MAGTLLFHVNHVGMEAGEDGGDPAVPREPCGMEADNPFPGIM